MHDKLDIHAFKARLIAQRDALLATQAARTEAGRAVELDQTRTGRLSRMDALQGQAMALANQQRADLQLKRIGSALRRIEAGTFGECAQCGDLIDPRRLSADPATPLCIGCASAR
jgi:DnaK suppressor protein